MRTCGQWCGGRFIRAGSSCLRDASADHTGLLSYPRSGGLTLESCIELQPSDGSIRTFYPCSWHGLEHKHKSECLGEILMPTVPNGPSSTDWGLVKSKTVCVSFPPVNACTRACTHTHTHTHKHSIISSVSSRKEGRNR